jgi:hypothetical protein
MSIDTTYSTPSASSVSARWRKLPRTLLIVGLVLALIGLIPSLRQQLMFSYLMAYMFVLSLCLGGLFLVLIHHLFDAAWSVPLRRVTEHLSVLLFPVMAILWIPIGVFAPKMYPWMQMAHPDHALRSKQALLNIPTWYAISIALFFVWGFLTRALRKWSLRQDETGSPQCTYKMRIHACYGIFLFAVTLTLACVLWVKTLEHEWFSTMYGVYYFAESVWTTLATLYVLMVLLKNAGPLANVITPRQVHDVGVLWFAFTVFYAYIHFSQYFIIWNANMPEETFWYIQRDHGWWKIIGLLIIFGHFFLPFLTMLRIDFKTNFRIMVPLAAWAWFMHFCDMSFNVLPVKRPTGFAWHWLDLACLAFIAGAAALAWLVEFAKYPPYPQKDPRMTEALGLHHPQVSSVVVAKYEGNP